MSTYFIADLHLRPNHPKLGNLFLQFLRQKTSDIGKVDALYILGDLFEVWLGDDDRNDFNQKMTQAIRNFTDMKVPVYFMHGNRDFFIGEAFAQQAGCTLLQDPSMIQLYDEKVLLMHGDLLCTEDVAYQRFRKVCRSCVIKKAFLWSPLWLRRWIAYGARRASKQYTRTASKKIMDVTPAAVLETFQDYPIQTLIHGHTHRPSIELLAINSNICHVQRIVLSDWAHQGNYLVCQPNGEKRLLYFD